MSKRATDAAWQLYPDYPAMDGGYVTQSKQRELVMEGYEQAEKDLALTWEDAYKIVSLAEEVKNDFCDNPNMFSILKPITVNDFKKVFNEEVLRRFNEWRDKK